MNRSRSHGNNSPTVASDASDVVSHDLARAGVHGGAGEP